MKTRKKLNLPLTLGILVDVEPTLLDYFPNGVPQSLPNPMMHVAGEPGDAQPFFDHHSHDVPNIRISNIRDFCDALPWLPTGMMVQWLPVWMAVNVAEHLDILGLSKGAVLYSYVSGPLTRALASGLPFLSPLVIERYLESTGHMPEINTDLEDAFENYKTSYQP